MKLTTIITKQLQKLKNEIDQGFLPSFRFNKGYLDAEEGIPLAGGVAGGVGGN